MQEYIFEKDVQKMKNTNDTQTAPKQRKPRTCTGKRRSNYGSALKVLRTMLGLSLEEFAEKCGISANLLSYIERGGSAKISIFEKIAAVFKVSLDALVRNDIGKVIASLPKDINLPDDHVGLIDIYQQNSMATGKKGEKYVVALQRAALADTPYANAVTDAPAHEAQAHFDVYSFSEDGTPKYIEVKSTPYHCDKPFDLTVKEYEFLLECIRTGKNYELHRVYALNAPEKVGEVIYTAQEVLDMFTMEPSVYKMHIKEECRNDRTAA